MTKEELARLITDALNKEAGLRVKASGAVVSIEYDPDVGHTQRFNMRVFEEGKGV